MSHDDIEAENLVERYVLGRLPVEEQIRFEQHFASCPACAEQIELAQELHTGLGEVAAEETHRLFRAGLTAWLTRHRRWLAPIGLFLVALPALWLALDNHRLRGDLVELRGPLANIPTFLLSVVRGATTPTPVLELPEGESWLALSIEAEPGIDSYDATLEDATGRVLWREAALQPNLWDVLQITLPHALVPPGEYRLVLASTGAEAGIYPFRIASQ